MRAECGLLAYGAHTKHSVLAHLTSCCRTFFSPRGFMHIAVCFSQAPAVVQLKPRTEGLKPYSTGCRLIAIDRTARDVAPNFASDINRVTKGIDRILCG